MNGADILMRVIQRLNSNPYNLTKQECISEVSAMRDAALAAPHPSQGAEVPKFSKWWKDKGQFISLPPGEPEDFALERAIAKAAWNAGREVGQNDTVAAPHPPVSAEAGKGVEPFGYVTKTRAGVQHFYPDAPYLDNAVECVTVYASSSESVAVSGEVSDEEIVEALREEMNLYDEGASVTDRAELVRAVRAVLAKVGGAA